MIKEYYNTPNNIVKIAQYLNHKETAFFNKDGKIIRCIKCFAPKYLKTNIDHFNIEKHRYNIYNSIADYQDFPLFSWKYDYRILQYKNWTQNKLYKAYIKGYEYIIDFDNRGDDEQVKQECIKTSKYLDSLEIAHTINFSGSGYHLRANMPKGKETPENAKRITLMLMKKLDLVTPDLSIYKWQGLIKTIWSIDCKTNRIAIPIKKEHLSFFEPKHAQL